MDKNNEADQERQDRIECSLVDPHMDFPPRQEREAGAWRFVVDMDRFGGKTLAITGPCRYTASTRIRFDRLACHDRQVDDTAYQDTHVGFVGIQTSTNTVTGESYSLICSGASQINVPTAWAQELHRVFRELLADYLAKDGRITVLRARDTGAPA